VSRRPPVIRQAPPLRKSGTIIKREEIQMFKYAIAAALVLSSGGMALAGGNSEAARAMAAVLSGTPGIGGVAPTVSGTNAVPGDSGWGNAGSRIVSGAQVSSR
jgi:hypothetical protein